MLQVSVYQANYIRKVKINVGMKVVTCIIFSKKSISREVVKHPVMKYNSRFI